MKPSVRVASGDKHELFVTTFYEGDERYKEVEVSLTYRDDSGMTHRQMVSWLAARRPSNQRLQRTRG